MKKGLVTLLAVASLAGSVSGCSYGMIATTGDKVVITRQDGFLFGILRKVFVCKITDGGTTNCQSSDNP